MGKLRHATGGLNSRLQSFDENLVWDDHACMPLRADVENFLPQLQRYRDSGVDVVSLNVGYDGVPWENTFQTLAHYRRWVRMHPEGYALVISQPRAVAASSACCLTSRAALRSIVS